MSVDGPKVAPELCVTIIAFGGSATDEVCVYILSWDDPSLVPRPRL